MGGEVRAEAAANGLFVNAIQKPMHRVSFLLFLNWERLNREGSLRPGKSAGSPKASRCESEIACLRNQCS